MYQDGSIDCLQVAIPPSIMVGVITAGTLHDALMGVPAAEPMWRFRLDLLDRESCSGMEFGELLPARPRVWFE